MKLMKLNKHDLKVACAANAILWLWNDLANRRMGDAWFKQDAFQAYRDSLFAMQTCGLIEDFDMVKVEVKIKGVWTNARTRLGD